MHLDSAPGPGHLPDLHRWLDTAFPGVKAMFSVCLDVKLTRGHAMASSECAVLPGNVWEMREQNQSYALVLFAFKSG